MYLVLELGPEIDEVILARGSHAQVIFSEELWGYWSVVIYVPDDEWADVNWLTMEDWPEGFLYMEWCKDGDFA